MEYCGPMIVVMMVIVLHVSLCKAMYDWKTKTYIEKDNSKLVVPGTKWCGKGNNAMSFDDLGENTETDLCCREHDFCPTYIGPLERRYGILNLYPTHLSHCSCEMKLYNCLWNVTSQVAVAVGRMYFSVLRLPCFRLVEVEACKKKSFDWWKFQYVCNEYGVEFKARTYVLKRFNKKLPVQPTHWNTTANEP